MGAFTRAANGGIPYPLKAKRPASGRAFAVRCKDGQT
jgi:hypothetical protein